MREALQAGVVHGEGVSEFADPQRAPAERQPLQHPLGVLPFGYRNAQEDTLVHGVQVAGQTLQNLVESPCLPTVGYEVDEAFCKPESLDD